MITQKTIQEEIDTLEKLTIESIQKDKKVLVEKIYAKVETLFKAGNEETKNLIATLFVQPLTTYLEFHYLEGKKYLDILPVTLKSEYRRQIYSSGI